LPGILFKDGKFMVMRLQRINKLTLTEYPLTSKENG